MPDPSGGELGRDVHRGYKCFDSGDCNNYLQDQGGGLQLVSYLARKMNQAKRGYTYSAYDSEALAVCGAFNDWRCYVKGRSKLLVVTYHDTLRHLLMQRNNKLNKRQGRYLRDLKLFVGSMALA
jgi:hypothetical protein